ncbi:MAG TPA: galactose-1-phosphate uridylyltransferase [Acidimicrobiales bacterium]|nr:galactose-1-phosphate uridylyltransferase [Acidimicrobiales bacterium]
MRKTSRRLADGREIIYYDAVTTAERNAVDGRDLGPLTASTELRYDPLLRNWVMYASHRQVRTYLPAADDCPLCPTKPGHPSEIPEADYEVVVFDNRFPALTGKGRCEVVCYTPDHNSSFAQLSPPRVRLLLEALIDQTTTLGALPGVEQVFCFENAGAEIGVTLQHPHGQIYAYPFVTPRTDRMITSVQGYRRRTGRNLFDDLVAEEIEVGSRLVLRTGRWTAFVPNAARWPYEIHCYPNARVPDLASLDGESLSELPEVLLDLFGRFARLFDKPAPYIAGWHQSPVRRGRKDFALHLELFTSRRSNDKMKFLASSESGMDAFANDIIPEAAAALLRELGPSAK